MATIIGSRRKTKRVVNTVVRDWSGTSMVAILTVKPVAIVFCLPMIVIHVFEKAFVYMRAVPFPKYGPE